MKHSYILLSSFLFFASCSLTGTSTSGEIIFPSSSGNMAITGVQDSTWVVIDNWEIQEDTVWSNETKDIILNIKNNTWALKINYGTWGRVRVHFSSLGEKSLTAKVQTPRDPQGNIRISQIIFPDGSADGPFWQDLKQKLTQSGVYQIILSANMMAGDPWSGEVDMYLELR